MAWFSISSGDKGVRVVSYTASASARAKATTITVKIEVSNPTRLGMLMDELAGLHHPPSKPKAKEERLALPAPDDGENV